MRLCLPVNRFERHLALFYLLHVGVPLKGEGRQVQQTAPTRHEMRTPHCHETSCTQRQCSLSRPGLELLAFPRGVPPMGRAQSQPTPPLRRNSSSRTNRDVRSSSNSSSSSAHNNGLLTTRHLVIEHGDPGVNSIAGATLHTFKRNRLLLQAL